MATTKTPSLSKSGRNTTAIFNPKTKSENTNANTASAKNTNKGGTMAQSTTGKQSQSQAQKSKTAQSKSTSKQSSSATGAKNWPSSQSWGQSSHSSQSNHSNQSSQSSQSNQSKNWGNSSNAKFEISEEVWRLNDADIISDVLASHKGLIKMYGTAMTEIDDEQLRTIIGSQMTECACDQYDAFLYMNQRGMYPTDPAPMPKIKQAKKRFSSLEQTFKM